MLPYARVYVTIAVNKADCVRARPISVSVRERNMSFFENLTTLQLVLLIIVAVAFVFAIVTLIAVSVYGKRHRDKAPAAVKQSDAAAPAAENGVAPVRSAQPAVSADDALYIPEGYVRRRRVTPEAQEEALRRNRAEETYSDQKVFVLDPDNPIAANSRPEDERQGDWSNYEGEFAGYYYDPLEGCYFPGKAPVYVQKTYLPVPPPPVVKKVMPPSAPILSKPKAARAPLSAKPDIASAIYGQYVIGTQGEEAYFTLYSNKGALLYASENYLTREYCVAAIKRFKKHVLVGAFSVEGEDGAYHYKLVRNLNTYIGPDKATRAEAEECLKQLKYYAQTDVVR